MNNTSTTRVTEDKQIVPVSSADAEMIKKVHRILGTGKMWRSGRIPTEIRRFSRFPARLKNKQSVKHPLARANWGT